MKTLCTLLAALALATAGATALIEGLIDGSMDPDSLREVNSRSYAALIRPIVSSLCNFASKDGVGSDECKACTDSLKLFMDHVLEKRTWAIMMLDSLLKPPPGLLSGTFSFVSHYDQCLKIPDLEVDDVLDVHKRYPDVPAVLRGAYCSFKLRIRRNPHFVHGDNGTLSEFEQAMRLEEDKVDDAYKLQSEFPGYVGLCVPSACTSSSFESIGRAVRSMLYKYVSENVRKWPVVVGVDIVSCRTRDSVGRIAWTHSARLAVGIVIVLVAIGGIGILVDVAFCLKEDRESLKEEKLGSLTHSYDRESPGDLAQLLRSCSPVVAIRRLMDTRRLGYRPPVSPATSLAAAADELAAAGANGVDDDDDGGSSTHCLAGVRFFALVWLVAGNTGQLRAANMAANLKEMQSSLDTMSSQFVLNKDLAVDSLFLVAGIVFACALCIRGGVGHMLRCLLHWALKTLPGYYLLVWLLVTCFSGLSHGPTWDIESQRFLQSCGKSWWTNIALVNNYVAVEDQCIPHSWLVAMLAQALLVAAVATFFWRKAQNLTHFILGNLVVVTMVTNFIINYVNDLGPTTLLREYRPGSRTKYMTIVGMRLYTRGGPFLIGLIIGYIFVEQRGHKRTFAKLGRLPVCSVWLMILGAIFATTNFTFRWNKGDSTPSPSMAALYDSVHRVVFSLASGLLVMMCRAGKGGFFNMLLSWPGFVPFSRLWLLMYLVHPFVIIYGNGTLRAPLYFTKTLLMSEVLWNFVVTFVVSVLLHVVLITPFTAFEHYVYRKLHRRRAPRHSAGNGGGVKKKPPVDGRPTSGYRSAHPRLASDDLERGAGDQQRHPDAKPPPLPLPPPPLAATSSSSVRHPSSSSSLAGSPSSSAAKDQPEPYDSVGELRHLSSPLSPAVKVVASREAPPPPPTTTTREEKVLSRAAAGAR